MDLIAYPKNTYSKKKKKKDKTERRNKVEIIVRNFNTNLSN